MRPILTTDSTVELMPPNDPPNDIADPKPLPDLPNDPIDPKPPPDPPNDPIDPKPPPDPPNDPAEPKTPPDPPNDPIDPKPPPDPPSDPIDPKPPPDPPSDFLPFIGLFSARVWACHINDRCRDATAIKATSYYPHFPFLERDITRDLHFHARSAQHRGPRRGA
jgi:hypothetical protein